MKRLLLLTLALGAAYNASANCVIQRTTQTDLENSISNKSGFYTGEILDIAQVDGEVGGLVGKVMMLSHNHNDGRAPVIYAHGKSLKTMDLILSRSSDAPYVAIRTSCVKSVSDSKASKLRIIAEDGMGLIGPYNFLELK